MASIAKRERKKGWSFQLRWRENNKNRRVCLDTQNKRIANLALKQLKQRLLEKRFDPFEKEQLTLSQFRDRYLEYRKPRKAKNTCISDMKALNSLVKCLGDVYLQSISLAKIEDEFVSVRLERVKPGTVNNELRHLKAAFNHAVDREYVESNPFLKVKLLKVTKSGSQFFSVEELRKLDKVIDREDYQQIMWMLVLTGMRIGELLDLKWKNIYLEQRLIRIHGKGDKVRIVGISDDLLSIVQGITRYENSEFVFPGLQFISQTEKSAYGKRSYSHLRRKFSEYLDQAGIQGSFHKFRHTFASLMLMRGVSGRAVQMLLGHESITTTELYTHLPNEFLVGVMNTLSISEIRDRVG
jgi:site-specific recombinase XerD